MAEGARPAPVITRTGDDGTTSLLGPDRVAKDHPQVEAFGAIDEATSAIGIARALVNDLAVRDLLLNVQQDLYLLMADLALPPRNWERATWRIGPDKVQWIEQRAAGLQATAAIEPRFVIPGETLPSAGLHLARAIVRRAERRVVALRRLGLLGNPTALPYLNRLSDLLFIAARYLEETSGGGVGETAPV
ncbi:MAG: cob(I)yrinic acid a,c-diamide adenosyltransferase [Chloroflexi bacterium]|nr:cob(I)yrinic acid a,c-diamide adenosyltransferase [Chloroflexota bacterium]